VQWDVSSEFIERKRVDTRCDF